MNKVLACCMLKMSLSAGDKSEGFRIKNTYKEGVIYHLILSTWNNRDSTQSGNVR